MAEVLQKQNKAALILTDPAGIDVNKVIEVNSQHTIPDINYIASGIIVVIDEGMQFMKECSPSNQPLEMSLNSRYIRKQLFSQCVTRSHSLPISLKGGWVKDSWLSGES